MAISDKKILTSERNAVYVKSNTGKRLTGTVEDNKNVFDKFPQLIMDKYNELVDLLSALGLDNYTDALSGVYTKDETDTLVSEKTNDLVETITFTKGDGKFIITTKSGKTTTIDTDLEKIPADFSIVEDSGKTYLRITNQDGTYTQTDVTTLITHHSFYDSETLTFIQPDEEQVTAEIQPNSITLNHLSLPLVTTLQGYVSDAKTQADNAKSSATASEKSANAAYLYMEAVDSMQGTINTYADNAKSSATSAAESAESAKETVTTVTQKATDANNSAVLSQSYSTLSQSYAKGGTGTRTGEDTDNAKYYMEQAKKAAGGDIDLTGYATTAYVDEKDTSLQNQINNKANASYVNQALVNVSNSISTIETNLSTKADKATTVFGESLGENIDLPIFNASTEGEGYTDIVIAGPVPEAEFANYMLGIEDKIKPDFILTRMNNSKATHIVYKFDSYSEVDKIAYFTRQVGTYTEIALVSVYNGNYVVEFTRKGKNSATATFTLNDEGAVEITIKDDLITDSARIINIMPLVFDSTKWVQLMDGYGDVIKSVGNGAIYITSVDTVFEDEEVYIEWEY